MEKNLRKKESNRNPENKKSLHSSKKKDSERPLQQSGQQNLRAQRENRN
jgi:hypothetical protein